MLLLMKKIIVNVLQNRLQSVSRIDESSHVLYLKQNTSACHISIENFNNKDRSQRRALKDAIWVS